MFVPFAQRMARISPALHRFGAGGLLRGLETYSAFVAGKGSGSGWDLENEAKSVGSLMRNSPAVIFDVGANDGRWSVALQRVLRNSGNRYFLFEPAEYCFAGLEKSKAALPEATIINAAISDRNGIAVLHLPKEPSGLASLHQRTDVSVVQHEYRQVEVPAITLDTVADSLGIEVIDLLKMDIEGHELAALRGAEKLLGRGAIKALVFEFGSANVNSRTFFRDFWDLLTERNYRLFRVVPGGGTTPIHKYTEDLEYFRGATNYVARLG